VSLTGCGLRDPYAQRRNPPAAVLPAVAVLPADGATATRAAGGATDVVARFATTWVNWSGASLARERTELLTLATGSLAAELRTDAAQATRSRLQEVTGAYSRGRFVGVITQAAGSAIVVTYEEAAPLGGHAQAAYHVYLARAARTSDKWRVTQWQPASDG
jgi:hypothetical protein